MPRPAHSKIHENLIRKLNSAELSLFPEFNFTKVTPGIRISETGCPITRANIHFCERFQIGERPSLNDGSRCANVRKDIYLYRNFRPRPGLLALFSWLFGPNVYGFWFSTEAGSKCVLGVREWENVRQRLFEGKAVDSRRAAQFENNSIFYLLYLLSRCSAAHSSKDSRLLNDKQRTQQSGHSGPGGS